MLVFSHSVMSFTTAGFRVYRGFPTLRVISSRKILLVPWDIALMKPFYGSP